VVATVDIIFVSSRLQNMLKNNGIFSCSYRHILFVSVCPSAAFLMWEKDDDVSLCIRILARKVDHHWCPPFVCPELSLQTTSLSNSITQGQGMLHH
jgi:hypothetical protein